MSTRKKSRARDTESDDEEVEEEEKRRKPALRKTEEKKPDVKKQRVTIPPAARNLYLTALIVLLVLSFVGGSRKTREATIQERREETAQEGTVMEDALLRKTVLLWNEVGYLIVKPDWIYEIQFPEPGITGDIVFSVYWPRFRITSTKGHTTITDNGPLKPYKPGDTDRDIGSPPRIRIESTFSGNTVVLKTTR